MITISTENVKFVDELILVAKLFYDTDTFLSSDANFDCQQTIHNQTVTTIVSSTISDFVLTRNDKILDKNQETKYLKRYIKLSLFEYLQKMFPDKKLPWGSLTGIRPTKLFYDLIKENNNDINAAFRIFTDIFLVSTEKALITRDIIKNQKGIMLNDNLVDLYINIPFCPSKCYYCSFVSATVKDDSPVIDKYLSALLTEIEETKKLIVKKNYIVKSIYIGGGTPTILSADQLNKLLSSICFRPKEFTVECGRPDTITKEKLDVLKKHGVTRISINPQTFCDKTLKIIGRNHTTKDIIETYKLALAYNFDINMDLIAGLKDETLTTFKRSINKTLEFAPENITIHTLSVKRGSTLKEQNEQLLSAKTVESMLDYSYKKLKEFGYKPYYLYRQKNMIGNFENVGYFRNSVCSFNIDTMEEIASVIACGANAISKRFYSSQNKIERFANVKNIDEYIARTSEMIEKKNNLFN